jgi:hypothetical protein
MYLAIDKYVTTLILYIFLSIISVIIQIQIEVFLVISMYFKLRNVVSNCGSFYSEIPSLKCKTFVLRGNKRSVVILKQGETKIKFLMVWIGFSDRKANKVLQLDV